MTEKGSDLCSYSHSKPELLVQENCVWASERQEQPQQLGGYMAGPARNAQFLVFTQLFVNQPL